MNSKEGTLVTPVKTDDAKQQDPLTTQTPIEESKNPLYIIPEQTTQHIAAPIPIIIMQQHDQTNNILNSNEQSSNVLNQQNNPTKESAIYYVPIQNVLQDDFYTNNQLPTAPTFLQIPLQSSESNLQLESVQNNVLLQQQEENLGKNVESNTDIVKDSVININNNGNDETVAKEQLVQSVNSEQQSFHADNQQLLNNNHVQQQIANLQHNQALLELGNSQQQQILAIQNNQQQVESVGNVEQEDSQQVYYLSSEQPIALPYVYLDQYTNEDRLTSNVKVSTNNEETINENKDAQVKEQTELSRIKQLLSAEKSNDQLINSSLSDQTVDQSDIKKNEELHLQDINQPQIYTLVKEQLYQSTIAPPQLKESIQYQAQVVQTNADYAQQEAKISSIAYTPQSTSNVVQEKENLEAIYALEQLSGYGSKINAQQSATVQSLPSRLIDSTKNMVSGVDVLNINAIQYTETESSTPNSITAEYVQVPLDTLTSSIETSQTHEEQTKLSSQQHFSTTPATEYLNEKEIVNLSEQPIVVEDENTDEQSIDVVVSSTTETSINRANTKDNVQNNENTVLVTPRPVSTHFLAPITAGVQLQSLEYVPNTKENVYVEIQKSVPYYLGKVEYVQGETKSSHKSSVNKNALDNLKDVNTLIKYNEGAMQQEVNVKEQFFQNNVNENCTETKQPAQQGVQHSSAEQEILEQQVSEQKIPSLQVPVKQEGFKQQLLTEDLSLLENIQASQELPLPQFLSTENKFTTEQLNQQLSFQQISKIEKDIIAAVANKEMTDSNNNHYYIALPDQKSSYKGSNQISEQHVQIPVPVLEPNTKIHTQIIEKPVHITKYVDRPYPVPVQVHVPVPYTVEKKVPVPVTVEKLVDRPVTVTKYVDRPVHVPQPYVVEKVVEKHVEVPVEVTKYIDRPYHIQVPVPQPVPYPVEIALPPPIPNDKPYINKNHNNKIENPRPSPSKVPTYDLHRQNNGDYGKPLSHYPHQPIQVDIPKYIDKVVNKPIPIYYLNDNKVQQTTYPSQYLYAPNYHPNIQCDQETSHSTKLYHTINPDDYIGLTPPKLPSRDVRLEDGRIRQNRHARHEFGKNLRIEYGFMPPLIPSLEIDENGQPVERNN